MKKLLLLAMVVIFASSCKKDLKEMQPSTIDNTVKSSKTISQANAPAYAQTHLEYWAMGIEALSNNTQFRNILHGMVNQQFDDDYNVLIKDLSDECVNNDFIFIDSVMAVLSANNVSIAKDVLLDAFNDINGNNYFPQVHIPNFTSFYQQSAGDIVSVAYNGDETISEFDAFDETTHNLITVLDDEVNLTYIEEVEVWVVSLSESVDDEGNLIVSNKTSRVGPSPDELGGDAFCITNPRIEYMNIKDANESFLGGKSDIFVKYASTWYDGKNPATGLVEFNKLYNYNAYGNIIDRVSKAEIGTSLQVDHAWTDFWCYDYTDPLAYEQKLPYIIYEYDNWPANTFNVDVPIQSSGTPVYTDFVQSSNAIYHSGYVSHESSLPNLVSKYTVSNADIEFNTTTF